MGEVLYLNMISRNDLLPDQVLDAAKDFGLTHEDNSPRYNRH